MDDTPLDVDLNAPSLVTEDDPVSDCVATVAALIKAMPGDTHNLVMARLRAEFGG